MIELCEYCLLYILLCASTCLCLVLIECLFILVATLDNDEKEVAVAVFVGEERDYQILLKTRDKSVPRQAIPMLAVILLIIIYHACFTSESFPK